MKTSWLTILICCLSPVAFGEAGVQLLIVQTNHGEAHADFPAPGKNDKWMGIFCEAAGCEAKAVPLSLSKTKIVPHYGETKEGTLVKVPTPDLPRFLVKGIASLKEGKVAVASVSDLPAKSPLTRKMKISIGKSNCELILELATSGYPEEYVNEDGEPYTPAEPISGESVNVSYSITLVEGTRKQVLAKEENVNHYVMGPKSRVDRDLMDMVMKQIRFIGDLDGDGKIDLVANTCLREPEMCFTARLFLSTKAAPTEITGDAASFRYWNPSNPGC